MKSTTILLVLVAALLSACGGKSTDNSATEAAEIIKAAAEEGLEIGTDIKDLVPSTGAKAGSESSFQTLAWADLVAMGYDAQTIMSRYQSRIQVTLAGSEEEMELYRQMDEEFNQSPPNAELAGKTIRIPGFVSPLEQNDGMVGDFLLVPYFGSCIHSPPPPVNQTILVEPEKGGSISMSKIRRPVWVTGVMKVETTSTDLAEAAYRIDNARIEEYGDDENAPDPVGPSAH